MAKYSINPNATDVQVVGKINAEHINMLLGTNIPDTEVLMYPGAIKHCKKKHEEIFNKYYHIIPDILEIPDYVGKKSNEPNSIELYKIIEDDLLLAIKLDPSGYLYLSSLYDLDNGYYKITKRLKSGRIVPFP